ncbi:MAG: hypothetical protein QOI98_1287, partial [Solirubrobacteraceae bacterium]|nr:hypothetical protein [Solirubrobacteraceae bacterium]
MPAHRDSGKVSAKVGRALATAVAVLAVAAIAPAAHAQTPTPYKDVASGGPLTHVYLGNELSCQVAHTGDAAFELFPSSSIPGSCGTFIFVNGALYAPDFANHSGSATSSLGAYTPYTVVSQSEVGGAGTTASPYKVTTVVDVGTTGLRITQVDTYVVGQESYRTDVTIQNTGGAALSGIVYRAGDCFLQGNDQGYGFVDTPNAAAGCSINANNSPPARIEQWFPLTAGATYMEAGFSTVWGAIGAHAQFPNTCECTNQIDNGAGISWNF